VKRNGEEKGDWVFGFVKNGQLWAIEGEWRYLNGKV
jgi:hypothetical protein